MHTIIIAKCIVLYCIVLYCIVLYCIVLYCIVLLLPVIPEEFDQGDNAADAFSFCWREFKPCIFPPVSLLGSILMKLKVDEVSNALIIAPWWPTAHWYPQLLQLLVQRPILLPQWDELLTLPQEDCLHLLKDVMRLAAWHVSGITYRSEEFLQGQPAICSRHGVPAVFSDLEIFLLLV